MSFQIRTLGGASLKGPDGPVTGRAAQRHRLALLALLAEAGPGGLSREKLAAYLWAESRGDRARRLLSDSVYRICRELGGEAITATGDLLRLDPQVLASDVARFREALDREDWAAAVEAYGGPFLDGFYLPDAVEFERWQEDTRAELARRHAAALEALARRTAEDGDAREAAALWQRRAALDPYDARVAMELMRALDAAGNRAAALRHARLHAQLLESEFGTGPDPDVTALADKLRTAPEASDERMDHDATGESPEPAPPVERPNDPAPAGAAHGERPDRPAADRPVVSGPASGTDLVSVAERDGHPLRATGGLLLALVAVVTLAGAWLAGRAAWGGPSGPERDRIAIAVLPFDDLSGDEQGFFFSEGVTEDVLTRLSTVEGFSVIARASVIPYRDSPKSIRVIGEELGVRYVVHGSVRRVGADVRITAQLVDARTNANVWAQSYDRGVEDIFAVQSDIAMRVATALEARLTQRVAADMDRVPTEDLAAYDAYLRGRFQWHLRTEEGLRRSVGFFEDAVERDPSYARAWAGLADAYAVLAFYDYLPPVEAFPKAADAALRALGIDDRLAEAHASLGYITLYHDWDAGRAEAAFRRSIELNPSYSTAHQWYANHLLATGRFDEAERAMNLARETNPLSLIANGALGFVYYYAGRYEDALRQCDLALEMDPGWDLGHLWRGFALEGMGRDEEAIEAHRRAVDLSGGSGISVAALARSLAVAGRTEEARAILARLTQEDSSGRYQPSFEIARVYVGLREYDEAIRWLERAEGERSHSMVFLEVDPQLAPLRQDGAFRALVERVGFTG
jgi:TolB-like protein/DNA-binding SARP family transcriptional activator/Flp pilus assembly protein TadD